MGTNSRVVKQSEVSGVFGLPIGVTFLNRGVAEYPKKLVVSTVCLEGAHHEDPLGICSPEHGYETMVFLDGCTFFSVYTKQYRTRKEAASGHNKTIKGIMKRTIPLAIPLAHYSAWEAASPSEVRK